MPCNHNTSRAEKVVIRRTLRRLGIKLSELPSGKRVEVRVWASQLTETQIDYVAETTRAVPGIDRRFLMEGDPRDEYGRFAALPERVTDDVGNIDDDVDACPVCDAIACDRCGRCACGCHCG